MLRLQRIFKNYAETGSFNEQVNLYGFVDSQVFLTKTGDLGVVLEVHGVDYECLDGNTLDGLTKRLESALKLFDDSYRIYQYLFKRNNETIPYKLYGKPVVDTAIENRLAYSAGKADSVFSLSIYYVILFEGFRYTRTLGSTLLEFPKHHRQASATNDKRNGSGEPSGFTGFPLRAGSTRACLLEDQRQTPPRKGHSWSQIHSS